MHADFISLSNANDPSDHPFFRKDVSPLKGGYAIKLSGVERDDAIGYISRFYPSLSELTDDIFTSTSVTVHGTCFKKDLNTIRLAQMTDSQPVFGSLENVWLSATHVFFGLKLYKADFSIDLNAYQIEEEERATGLFVIEVGDLLMTSVMHIYKHERCQYICPREDPSTILDN